MRPVHPSLDQFLTYKMHRLMKQHDKRIAQSYADAAQLSLAESRVLAAVGTAGALSNSELARRANLDKSQASRGADGLVSRGLVRRGPDEHDGRAVKVSLTPEGERVWRVVIDAARAHYERLFDALTDDEMRVYERLLDKLLVRSDELDSQA
ncbi:MarR family transcriptional regulator [Pandoraea fibrosis]|uniref:MarR family transcriptional regulator n=1 Tax=Pandoraea fibrosis TaxID=1891094 RepID=A0ABX6HKU8_9BURK|nr:MarR family transcriptional regulator [Pandoraea fibrosis]QHE90667.1 MarR family transcriptional regulator [Pandoraea fibrosis]QHF11498.1 MarR family transcriptional regulator [Pandoraea fibrosis]